MLGALLVALLVAGCVGDDVPILLAGSPADKRAIVLVGQSNAGIQGIQSELSGADLTLVSSPYIPVLAAERLAQGASYPPTWTEYAYSQLQLRQFLTAENRYGVENTMMRDIVAARPSTRWLFIRASVGGTTLNDQWLPGLGTFFTDAHNYIDAQLAAKGATIAAYVWIQGENDAMQVSRAANYAANLATYIAAIRTRYGSVPFVYGRLNVAASPTYTSVVRAAQDAQDGVNGAHMVDQDTKTLRGDGLHYTSTSVLGLGPIYAAKILQVVAP